MVQRAVLALVGRMRHREFGDRDYVHGYTTCVSEKHYAYQEYGGERHGYLYLGNVRACPLGRKLVPS